MADSSHCGGDNCSSRPTWGQYRSAETPQSGPSNQKSCVHVFRSLHEQHAADAASHQRHPR